MGQPKLESLCIASYMKKKKVKSKRKENLQALCVTKKHTERQTMCVDAQLTLIVIPA